MFERGREGRGQRRTDPTPGREVEPNGTEVRLHLGDRAESAALRTAWSRSADYNAITCLKLMPANLHRRSHESAVGLEECSSEHREPGLISWIRDEHRRALKRPDVLVPFRQLSVIAALPHEAFNGLRLLGRRTKASGRLRAELDPVADSRVEQREPFVPLAQRGERWMIRAAGCAQRCRNARSLLPNRLE